MEPVVVAAGFVVSAMLRYWVEGEQSRNRRDDIGIGKDDGQPLFSPRRSR